MPSPDIPLNFLIASTENARKDFMLATLNRITELKRARKEIAEELLEETCRAMFCEWLAAHKDELVEACRAELLQKSFEFKPEPIRYDGRSRRSEAA